ncbi:MAG: hypothetical protein JWO81_2751 [Alphaproteobacteria bacterium]|nr:hypothetical protein [Alphaproteobacteria bacterium]
MTKQCCNHGAGDKPSSTVVGLLERPLYAPGLILEDSDLTAGVDYTRSLSRLLFRSLFGCGVICGLTVRVEEECGLQVTVAPGLALDGCGDPIQLPRPETLKLDKRYGVIGKPEQQEPPRVRDFWVVLCAGEKRCAPRAVVCDADEMEGASQHTRARALAELSIAFERPKCICECEAADGTPTAQEYDARAGRLLPYNPHQNTAPPAGQRADCQRKHNEAVDCAPDCGCDTGCGCDCCVLLAWVHWYQEEQAWGVLHGGVRRLIRPELRVDPIQDERPARRVPEPIAPAPAPTRTAPAAAPAAAGAPAAAIT